jgi:hypothetical protein
MNKANKWPFADPTNTVAITTRQVLREGYPVLFVSHDTDGNWQVLCGTTTDEKDALVICLGEAVQRDRSITDLADMPRGWSAWRRSPGDSRTREPICTEPEIESPSA